MAGSSVETSVPKNGTMATRPVNTPNASAYGTFSSTSPSQVSTASENMASSWPTIHARSVTARSVRRSRTSSRCTGGASAISPSRYMAGRSVM